MSSFTEFVFSAMRKPRGGAAGGLADNTPVTVAGASGDLQINLFRLARKSLLQGCKAADRVIWKVNVVLILGSIRSGADTVIRMTEFSRTTPKASYTACANS